MKKIIQNLKDLGAKKVFIQYPEGIKLRIQDIVKKIEENSIETIICIETTFGACDIRDEEALRFGCDAILHIGHSDLGIKSKLPVFFWEYFMEADPIPILEKELDKLKDFKRIGLITSIQFVKTIPLAKEYLEKKGKEVFVHKALQYPGQVLGCNLEAAKAIDKEVDCFLCISAGEFYADGIVLSTKKPVFNLDLEKRKIYSLEEFRKKIQRIIAWNRAQLEDARRIGILVSWKKGQMLYDPFGIKKKLEKRGKEVYIIAMDEITPEKIEGLKLDALISCACPRIGIDDLERYKIPIINSDLV